jgi:hypothetical protein
MTIFTLAHTDYEEYSPHHFKAPEGATEADFDKLCNDLIEPAVNLLIKKKGHLDWSDEDIEKCGATWIGWDHIVNAIGKLLPEHGYEPIRFYEVFMWGGGIIGGSLEREPYEEAYHEDRQPHEHQLTKEVYDRIADFNQELAKKLYADRLERKAKEPVFPDHSQEAEALFNE